MIRRMLVGLLAVAVALSLSVWATGPAAGTTGPSLELPFYHNRCEGLPTTLAGSGFTPGQAYQFSATLGSLQFGTLTAKDDGTLAPVLTVPADSGAAATSTVTASRVGEPGVTVASLTIDDLRPASLEAAEGDGIFGGPRIYPAGSHPQFRGTCFPGNEDIELSSPQMTFSISSSSQDSYEVYIDTTVLAVRATGTATVTATGMTSGFHASTQISSGGSALDAGTELTYGGLGQLISPSSLYRLRMAPDRPYICRYKLPLEDPFYCNQIWTAPVGVSEKDHNSSLQLRASGNLVLFQGAKPIWSTGTSGAGNQLTMRDDGNLALTNPQHEVLWSSNTGLVRGAAGYVSLAYIAASRVRNAVYINGLVKQWNRSAQLVRGAGRVVYLQRLLNGSWQNMLSRTADSVGRLVVGFIQPKAYSYRWVMVASGGAAGARSMATSR